MSVAETKFELCRNVEQVLKIGRDFQSKDSWRGEQHDTAKLLCDTIEYLRDQLPEPDPDWKAICEKCHCGEIEPDCEYYGEPNGCNSPIYGEHPKSAPVGNSAAMREALEAAWRLLCEMQNYNRSPISNQAYAVKRKIKAALAAPPRNCDKYASRDDASKAFMDIEELPESNGDWQMREWFRRFATWSYQTADANEKGDDNASK